MSLVLPGETVYVDGVDVGIVNVRPPTGVDCALRILVVPPLFVRVTLYVVLGVKPEPSNTTAAALWSRNDAAAAERLVTSRFATEPVHEACRFWEAAVLAVSKTIKPHGGREVEGAAGPGKGHARRRWRGDEGDRREVRLRDPRAHVDHGALEARGESDRGDRDGRVRCVVDGLRRGADARPRRVVEHVNRVVDIGNRVRGDDAPVRSDLDPPVERVDHVPDDQGAVREPLGLDASRIVDRDGLR